MTQTRAGFMRIAAAMTLALAASGVAAQTGDDRFAPVTQFQLQQLTERLDRFDRLVSGSGMSEIAGSVATLERELRGLRGEVETLNFQLDRADRAQRARLTRIEQRLDALESGDMPVAASDAGDPPAAGSAEPSAPIATNAEDVAERSDAATDAESAASASPTPIDDDELRTYQRAFDAMMAGDDEQAADLFSAFLDVYPEGQYAGDAWYWMGEAHHAQGDHVAAIEMFGTVVDRFPDASRHADAKLKLGYAYGDAGDLERARTVLEEVRDEHDGTAIGRLAEDRLRRLERAQ